MTSLWTLMSTCLDRGKNVFVEKLKEVNLENLPRPRFLRVYNELSKSKLCCKNSLSWLIIGTSAGLTE